MFEINFISSVFVCLKIFVMIMSLSDYYVKSLESSLSKFSLYIVIFSSLTEYETTNLIEKGKTK